MASSKEIVLFTALQWLLSLEFIRQSRIGLTGDVGLTKISTGELPGRRSPRIRRAVMTMLGFLLIFVCFCCCSKRRVQRTGFWVNQWRDRGAIVFVGDSIIAGWSDLSGAFPGYKVANRGLAGDRTYEALARLNTDVLRLKPSALVVLIGTNDLNDGAESETVLENFKLLMGAVREKLPAVQIIICTLTPRASVPGRFPGQILKFNEALKKTFGNAPGILVFDVWSLFANESGQPRPEDFPDLLHPSPAAYHKWATALTPVFDRLNAASLIVPNR